MVELLDLKVCDAKVEYDGIYSGKCGYALLNLSFIIKLRLYVKYEIPRGTYQDKLVVYRRIKPAPSPYEFGRVIDKAVTNPSDQSVIKEEVIDATIYAVVSYTGRTDDMRKSGYREFTVSVYGENQACMKTLNVSFYWNASNCTVSNVKVSGIEECPPIVTKKIVLTSDRDAVFEGETVNFTADVYGTPGTSVKTCVYVEGVRKECYLASLDDYGHGVLKFNVTFSSYGTYRVKACVVNPITNEPAYCSNEITITVERGVELPKPKIDRNYTRLVWDGHYYSPGTYKVPKGTKVLASVSIWNEGGDGKVGVVVWDSYEGKVVYREDMDMRKGQSVSFGRTFTVDRNCAIKIITYYYDPADGKFKKYDEYG